MIFRGVGNTRHAILSAILIFSATPSLGQDRLAQNAASPSVRQLGVRQAPEQTAPNIEPLGRLNNRIANRVQSRIRSRIDRSYDPQANTMSPFKAAGEKVRMSGTLRQP